MKTVVVKLAVVALVFAAILANVHSGNGA